MGLWDNLQKSNQIMGLAMDKGLKAWKGTYNPLEDPETKRIIQTAKNNAGAQLTDFESAIDKTGLPGISASYLSEKLKTAGGDAILNLANTLFSNAREVSERGLGMAQKTTDDFRQAVMEKEKHHDEMVAEKRKQQTSSANSAMGICCFIVIQGEGVLTDEVRMARNIIMLVLGFDMAEGYRKMQTWLIPMMQKHRSVMWLIRATMTRPITLYSLWRVRGIGTGYLFIPNGLFWLAIWKWMGSRKILNFYKAARILSGI